MNYEPGWYSQPDGQQRYYDGQNWTEHLAPVAVAEPVQFEGQNWAEDVAPVGSAGPVQFSGPVVGEPNTVDELAEARSAAQRMVYIGLAILVVGIAITVGTYVAADEGGTFFAAWGAIIIGGIRMAQGIFYLANPARLLK